MTYQLAYDVLDDQILPSSGGGVVLLVVTLIWLGFWGAAYRWAEMSPPRHREMRWAWIPVALFAVLAIWLTATRDYPSFADQRQCRTWSRTGDYETTEGRVSLRPSGPPDGNRYRRDFWVGDVPFTYYRYLNVGRGGFQGSFTAADAANLLLSEGLRVRIAHRNGRILRIETADP